MKQISIILLTVLLTITVGAYWNAEAWGGYDWKVVLGPDSAGTVYEQRECKSCYSVEEQVECVYEKTMTTSRVGMWVEQQFVYTEFEEPTCDQYMTTPIH